MSGLSHSEATTKASSCLLVPGRDNKENLENTSYGFRKVSVPIVPFVIHLFSLWVWQFLLPPLGWFTDVRALMQMCMDAVFPGGEHVDAVWRLRIMEKNINHLFISATTTASEQEVWHTITTWEVSFFSLSWEMGFSPLRNSPSCHKHLSACYTLVQCEMPERLKIVVDIVRVTGTVNYCVFHSFVLFYKTMGQLGLRRKSRLGLAVQNWSSSTLLCLWARQLTLNCSEWGGQRHKVQ